MRIFPYTLRQDTETSSLISELSDEELFPLIKDVFSRIKILKAGVWRVVLKGYIKQSGVWKEIINVVT